MISSIFTGRTSLDGRFSFVMNPSTPLGKHILQTFEKHWKEALTQNGFCGTDSNTALTCVSTRCVARDYVLSLHRCGQERYDTMEPNVRPQKLQRVFGSSKLGPSKNTGHSFGSHESRSDKNMTLCAMKLLFLLRIHKKKWKEQKEFAFERYKYATSLRDNVDRALGRVSIQWSRDEFSDYIVAQRGLGSRAYELNSGEWFGFEPFYPIRSTIPVVQKSFVAAPLSYEVPRPPRRFYIHSFIKAYRQHLRLKRELRHLVKGKAWDK